MLTLRQRARTSGENQEGLLSARRRDSATSVVPTTANATSSIRLRIFTISMAGAQRAAALTAAVALAFFLASAWSMNDGLQGEPGPGPHESRARHSHGSLMKGGPGRRPQQAKSLPFEPRGNRTWVDVGRMQLDAVTVTGSGEAELARSVEVDVSEEGIHQVALWNITKSMIPDTARITGSGSGSVMVLEIAEGRSKPPSLEEDKGKAAELRKQISELERKNQLLREQDSWLAKTTTTAAETGTWKDIQEMDKWRLERRLELGQELAALQDQLDSLSQEEQELLRSMNTPTRRKQITVDLRRSTASSGPVKLELRYRVYGASWSAEYDLVSSPDSSSATLTYFGKVQQATGEDWEGAVLTLSTSSAERNVQLPEVHPQVLSLNPRMERARSFQIQSLKSATRMAKPMMMARGRSRGDGEPMMTMEMDEEMDAAEAEMAEDGGAEAFDLPPPLISRPSMSVTQGSTGIKYILPHRTSIPSEPQNHRLFITAIELEPSFFYAGAPRLEQKAYLLMKVRNPSQYTLLPGPVTSIVDDNLGGASFISLTAPLEETEISLGVDDAVRVKVIPATKLDSKLQKSLFSWSEHGDRSRRAMAHVMSIENKKAGPVKIRVKDVLPTVSNSEIKVELTDATRACKAPAAAAGCSLNFSHEEDSGKVTWDLELPPSGEQRLQLKFSVEWPKNEHYPSGLDMAE